MLTYPIRLTRPPLEGRNTGVPAAPELEAQDTEPVAIAASPPSGDDVSNWVLLAWAIANLSTAIAVATLVGSRLDVYARGGSVAVHGVVAIQNGTFPVRVEIAD
jgi:hypothetical protein